VAGQQGDYGVVCGCGNLAVIDADKQEVADAVTENLPETLVVKTGSGGLHFLLYSPEYGRALASLR